MPLIASISGIRGTIGGPQGEGLTPADVVAFSSAYGTWLKTTTPNKAKVVIGRDARPSGQMVRDLVVATLSGLGIDVIDLGLSTTPTVEMAVTQHKTDGGIIITASHNPIMWNALKLLNAKGEFLNDQEGSLILKMAREGKFDYAAIEDLGQITEYHNAIADHVRDILACKEVDAEAVAKANFSVAIDAVNSTGGIAIPAILEALGVNKIHKMYCEPTGWFPHNPEPLKEHLGDIMELMKREKCDLGIVVDPDVDRLAFIDENGEMFGEEYTLVAVADYLLSLQKGNTVSNLSSTRALADLTHARGGEYFASAVGEVNVVTKMKEVNAVIGGEGNGGVIWPKLHYGRDALAGVALVLTYLAKSGKSLSQLKSGYPQYFMSKNKIQLQPGMDTQALLDAMRSKYSHERISTVDGVKIDFAESWVHLRRSNTEPIIRIYTEAKSQAEADALAERFVSEFQELIG